MCSLCTWKRIFIQLFTEMVHHRLLNKCADHLSIMSFGCVDTILVICYEYKHIHFPHLLLIFKTTWRTLYLHCCTMVISVPRDKLRESQIWARRRWHNFPLIPKTFFLFSFLPYFFSYGMIKRRTRVGVYNATKVILDTPWRAGRRYKRKQVFNFNIAKWRQI